MAFNPFNAFRRNRKAAFAVLTIVTMFIFILTGTGAAVDPLFALLSGRGRVPKVAELDGETIDAIELDQARRQRRVANEYMAAIVNQAVGQILSAGQSPAKDADPVVGRTIQRVVFTRLGNPQIHFQTLGTTLNELEQLAETMEKGQKPDEAQSLRRLARALILDRQLVGASQLRDGMYFGGSVATSQEVLDHLVWKWVADRRGITLTPEVVQQMIRDETLGQDIDSEAMKVEQDLMKRYQISSATIMEYLIDEFRVRLAKQAVLGQSAEMSDTFPSFVTPHEFYKFFRDNRTQVRVHLLPINAESYLSKVTETPSEAELKELYEKYKSEERSPLREEPGFKLGRQAKLEWIGMTAQTPAFKKAAMEQAQKDSEQAARITQMIYAPPVPSLAGVLGRTGDLAVVTNPNLIDRRIDREYEQYVRNQKFINWMVPFYSGLGLHERNLYQPMVITSGISTLASALGTQGLPINGLMAWTGQAFIDEMRERIRLGMLAFPGPMSPAVWRGINELAPEPLGRNALVHRLREAVTDEIEKKFIDTEFSKFQQDLAQKAKDIKKPGVKEELNKYVQEFVKKYDLQHGASTELRDMYEMINDPGVAPLKEAYLKHERGKSDPMGVDFGAPYLMQNQFFSPQPAYEPNWLLQESPMLRSQFEEPDQKYFLVWKTEEVPSKVRTFDEARVDVERAWRLNKARDLARQGAEELQKKLREQAVTSVRALTDFAAQQKLELIELDPVAKIQERPAAQARGPQYQLPEVSPKKVPYPSSDFALKLVDLRDKPIGETIVLPNAPKTTYYVGVLTDRIVPDDQAFRQSYAAATATGAFSVLTDPLRSYVENESRHKMAMAMIDQLRREARLVVKEEALQDRDTGE